MTASPTLFRRKDTPLTLTFPLHFEHVFVMNALPYVRLGCDGWNSGRFLSIRGGALRSKVLAFSARSHGDPPVESQRTSSATGFEAPTAPAWGPSLQPSTRERALRVAERLVLASGIVLFFILLARLGVDNVLANLRLVGWGIPDRRRRRDSRFHPQHTGLARSISSRRPRTVLPPAPACTYSRRWRQLL